MKPDEIMVYTAMFLVPVSSGIACCLLLRAVRRDALSPIMSSVLFAASIIVGMALSFAFVLSFSFLLSGDGALAIIAAPVTGAILTVPVAIVFFVALAVMQAKKSSRRAQ